MKRGLPLLLLLVSCVHAPTPAELLDRGQDAEAFRAVLALPRGTEAEDRARSAEFDRLGTLWRHRHPGRVEAHVLSREEVTVLAGSPPSEVYGREVLIVDVEVAPGSERDYRLFGYTGLELEHDADGDDARGLWSEVPIFPGEDGDPHGMVGEQLTRLWTLPPVPPGTCTGGDGTYIPAPPGKALLGVVLFFTGITPLLSVLTQKDQITPLFNPGTYIPGKHPPTCTPPSPEALAAWAESPPVHAMRTVAATVRAGAPAEHGESTRVRTLLHWVGRASRTPRMPSALVIGLSENVVTADGKRVGPGQWVRVPLVPASSVAAQVQATFGSEGVPVQDLDGH